MQGMKTPRSMQEKPLEVRVTWLMAKSIKVYPNIFYVYYNIQPISLSGSVYASREVV